MKHLLIPENPCVPGSIPGGTTENQGVTAMQLSFFIVLTPCFSPNIRNLCKPACKPWELQ